jgi:hypothetical protein
MFNAPPQQTAHSRQYAHGQPLGNVRRPRAGDMGQVRCARSADQERVSTTDRGVNMRALEPGAAGGLSCDHRSSSDRVRRHDTPESRS